MSAHGLIWYSTNRATVGLVVWDDFVVDAPPYARSWAMGRNALELWHELLHRPDRIELFWISDTKRTE